MASALCGDALRELSLEQHFSLWKMGLGLGALREGGRERWHRTVTFVTRLSLVLLISYLHQGVREASRFR